MIANLPPIKNAFLLLVLVSSGGLIPLQKALAEPRCEQPAATLESSNGLVEWRANREQAWANATLGQSFCTGDTLLIKQERAALRLANNTLVRLKEKSRITLLPEKKSFWVELKEGAAHFLSRTPRAFTVKAPYMNAAVDGTEFVVTANKAHNRVAVLEGQVRASNAYGEAVLTQGMQTLCNQGEAPQVPVKIRLQDSAEWVLYYPPLLMEQNVPADVQTLIEAHKLAEAERQLAKLPQDSHLLTYRAFLALASGHHQKASTLLSEAKALSPQTAEQKALQVLITLVKGDKEKALSLSTGLIEEHPANSSALLAHSYALQANTRIEEAFDIANNLRTSHPNKPTVQARFIELSLSLGQTRKAKQQLKEVLQRHPNNSRLLTLAGFVELNQLSSKSALKYFEQAIRLNSEDSLSQLGKALALIQRGEIEQGRQAMELAILLDPTSALLRSYLGKTYFAQQHNDWSATQYQLAKTLDPNDPTPWYYEAHLKLKQNKPVEALRLINTAIEKNDNRAVYRSRMLLDSDAAARSANQAGIYQALGFHELAQNTAAMAVSENPTDFAAHQALTLAYSEDPRAHRVRADEALMTKILQPIGAKALSIGTGTIGVQSLPWLSPSQVGMNEYSRLFTQKGLSGQVSTFGGTQATKGYQWQMQNIARNTSVDFGQYHFETEGFRTNNHLKEHISEINFHHQATDRFKYFLQHSERSQDSGDLVHGIESEEFDDHLGEQKDWKTTEFGVKHNINSRSNLFIHATDISWKNLRQFSLPNIDLVRTYPQRYSTESFEVIYQFFKYAALFSVGYTEATHKNTNTLESYSNNQSYRHKKVFLKTQGHIIHDILYSSEISALSQHKTIDLTGKQESFYEYHFFLTIPIYNDLVAHTGTWRNVSKEYSFSSSLDHPATPLLPDFIGVGYLAQNSGYYLSLRKPMRDSTVSLRLKRLNLGEVRYNSAIDDFEKQPDQEVIDANLSLEVILGKRWAISSNLFKNKWYTEQLLANTPNSLENSGFIIESKIVLKNLDLIIESSYIDQNIHYESIVNSEDFNSLNIGANFQTSAPALELKIRMHNALNDKNNLSTTNGYSKLDLINSTLTEHPPARSVTMSLLYQF